MYTTDCHLSWARGDPQSSPQHSRGRVEPDAEFKGRLVFNGCVTQHVVSQEEDERTQQSYVDAWEPKAVFESKRPMARPSRVPGTLKVHIGANQQDDAGGESRLAQILTSRMKTPSINLDRVPGS